MRSQQFSVDDVSDDEDIVVDQQEGVSVTGSDATGDVTGNR